MDEVIVAVQKIFFVSIYSNVVSATLILEHRSVYSVSNLAAMTLMEQVQNTLSSSTFLNSYILIYETVDRDATTVAKAELGL